MKVATDIGGTFTDLVYVDQTGKVQTYKSNTTPERFEEGVINVINDSGINEDEITQFIHGSTVVINTITERKGVKTALLTTEGFRDILEIARGNRPDLFNIRYKKPVPFVSRMLRREVLERMDYQGNIVKPLNERQLIDEIEYLKNQQVEAIAISFLHSYINPEHEILAKEVIKRYWPEVFVTLSHEISKEMREYERSNTAVLNAYVKPIANSYLNNLESEINKQFSSKNLIMQSNGGTSTFSQAKSTPIHMLESGPVAGVYGASVLGDLIGENNIIAFDIGGTTAKCSLIENGKMKISTNYYVEKTEYSAGYPVKVPVVDIVEIGNGGGSIAWIDEVGSLKVGPISAGSTPGPIAYGQGGKEPTTTDANLLTGRLSKDNFQYEVDMKKIENKIQKKVGDPLNIDAMDAALGIIRIANSNMLSALRLISTRRGYDPREFTLVAFGGGGSMHAVALAKELGIKKVVIPFASPVFAAWGMLMTDYKTDEIITYNKKVKEVCPVEIEQRWTELQDLAMSKFEGQVDDQSIFFSRFLDMRYIGQEHTVKVPIPNDPVALESFKEIKKSFHDIHERSYSFKLEETDIEIVNLHLTAFGQVEKPEIAEIESNNTLTDAYKGKRDVYFESIGSYKTPVYEREKFPVDKKVHGPLIIEEMSAVTILDSDQTVYADRYGNLIIEMKEI